MLVDINLHESFLSAQLLPFWEQDGFFLGVVEVQEGAKAAAVLKKSAASPGVVI
jgi:hypothetical protein